MRKESFSTPGTVHLHVDNAAGSVDISTHEDEATEIELSIEGSSDDDALLDEARVEASPTADGYDVVIEIPRRHGGFGGMLRWLALDHGVSVVVRVPNDALIDVKTASASIDATGRYAEASVKTASGTVSIETTTGDLLVKSASGKVAAESVGGTTTVDSASGRVRLGTLLGAASIRTASGRVSVDRAPVHLGIRTASGSVGVGSAEGEVEVATASGDLRVERLIAGTAKIRSVSGSIEVGIEKGTALHVDAQALSGSIDSEIELSPERSATDAPSEREVDLDIHSVSGSVRVFRAESASA